MTDPNTENEINTNANNITDQLEISDRVEQISLKEAYITVKDHKNEFPNKISCRLINPTKSIIGKISKHFLDKNNQNLKEKLKFKRLKNTEDTIEWFKTWKMKRTPIHTI